ncbi:uncharacterized protein RJT21DRAFT_31799 [Scheffersomyces amazonensis]|uniref:uncharacterized protein n=1 Tax=Scheffersomyces amazonensis TaxID=1078765 RepID=UPI00315D21D2
MSDLARRLGPQGRQLLYSQQGFTGVGPQELDFVVHELRNPRPDTNVRKVLGYMYNYLPYVKHEHNLRVLVASFLNNPVCFGSNTVPFESNYLIIEVFKLITDKKLKISIPTLSLKSFYSVILTELTNFAAFNPVVNSWKVLPIITGLLLSNTLRDELYVFPNVIEYRWFFSDWDTKILELFYNSLNYSVSAAQPDDVVNLSLVSYALIFKKDQDIKTKVSSSFIIQKLAYLLFSHPDSSTLSYRRLFELDPNSQDSEQIIQEHILQKPTIKHLNKISFLLQAYFKVLPLGTQSYNVINNVVDTIVYFNRQLNHTSSSSEFNNAKSSISTNHLHQQYWFIMKNILFSQTIIIQGILTRCLINTSQSGYTFSLFGRRNQVNKIEHEYHQISLKILSILYYANFILLSIGQGGFDNYNFVYYLTLELSISSNGTDFENLTKYLISNYQEINFFPQELNNNYIMRSKVLFVLGLWENYLQKASTNLEKNERFIDNSIFQLSFDLVDDTKYIEDDLIEASHSVLLFCFSSLNSNSDLSRFINYGKLLFNQFPRRISSQQLNIAVETIGKKVLSNPFGDGLAVENFLNFVSDECAIIRPGIKIPSVGTNGNANNFGFASAQPIQEIAAESVLANLDEKDGDVIAGNRVKPPKDVSLFPDITKNPLMKDYEFENRLVPETSREAAIVSFITLLPYLPLSIFLKWTDRIWSLITSSNPKERIFLINMLWKSLSENLDLNRVELAIRWWYNIKRLPEIAIVNHQSRL